MVKRSKGILSKKTRRIRRKRKVTVSEMVQKFKVGEKVLFCPQATTRGRPHLRYKDKCGVIKETRGRNSYVVEIKDGGKTKQLVTGAIHLRVAGGVR